MLLIVTSRNYIFVTDKNIYDSVGKKSNEGSWVMAITFFNPISDNFHRKPTNASYPDEKIEVCVGNINEFLSIIKTFHGIRKCNLERCQVRLFLEGLERS